MPPFRRSPRTGLPLIPREPPCRTARCDDPPPAGLRGGIALFNAGAYWECHEALEDLWRVEPDPVRYLYQGILLAGVGLLHARRGNRRGARSKLRAGYALLEPYAPACMGVDVDALRADILRVLTYLDGLAQSAPVSLPPDLVPTVRLAPTPDADG